MKPTNIQAAAELLDAYSNGQAALANISAEGFSPDISVSNEEDNDFYALSIDADVAKAALVEQLARIEKRLHDLGVSIEP